MIHSQKKNNKNSTTDLCEQLKDVNINVVINMVVWAKIEEEKEEKNIENKPPEVQMHTFLLLLLL